MSEKQANKERLNCLLEDKLKVACKIIALKLYCQKNPNDIISLFNLEQLIKLAEKKHVSL